MADEKPTKMFERKRMKKVFSNYAEKSSVSGIALIIGSKYPAVRILWTLLLIFALGAMTFHLWVLFEEYYEYEKVTDTTLNFSVLPFPAVTFCNVNPIRMSKIKLATSQIQNMIAYSSPKRLIELQEEAHGNEKTTALNSPPPFATDDYPDDYFHDHLESIHEHNHVEKLNITSSKIKPEDSPPGFDGNLEDMPPGYEGNPEDMPPGFESEEPGEEDVEDDTEITMEEVESAESRFHFIQDEFRNYYARMDIPTRRKMGHALKDLVVHCSIGGKKCKPSDFKPFVSNHYGNCYTLEYSKEQINSDGPNSGLELILYLQREDHIKGFTTSNGARIDVHEVGTVPSPHDNGFSVSAGTHTMISLRMLELSRLGQPYGECVPEGETEYLPKTIKYTRQTCQKFCQLLKIWEECKCVQSTYSNIMNALYNDSINRMPCDDFSAYLCATDLQQKISANHGEHCQCPNPCSERKYLTSVSATLWPDEDYATMFVNSICKRHKGAECEALKKKHKNDLREEFVKLSIYYEDLNYEQLVEVPNYLMVNLLSDVGGTIGLWIGLSLLSMLEIVHLITSFMFTTCFKSCKKYFKKEGDDDEAA